MEIIRVVHGMHKIYHQVCKSDRYIKEYVRFSKNGFFEDVQQAEYCVWNGAIIQRRHCFS